MHDADPHARVQTPSHNAPETSCVPSAVNPSAVTAALCPSSTSNAVPSLLLLPLPLTADKPPRSSDTC